MSEAVDPASDSQEKAPIRKAVVDLTVKGPSKVPCNYCAKKVPPKALVTCLVCHEVCCTRCASKYEREGERSFVCEGCWEDDPIFSFLADPDWREEVEGPRKRTYEDMICPGWLPKGWTYSCDESRKRHKSNK